MRSHQQKSDVRFAVVPMSDEVIHLAGGLSQNSEESIVWQFAFLLRSVIMVTWHHVSQTVMVATLMVSITLL